MMDLDPIQSSSNDMEPHGWRNHRRNRFRNEPQEDEQEMDYQSTDEEDMVKLIVLGQRYRR
jgi:hypothetical protein